MHIKKNQDFQRYFKYYLINLVLNIQGINPKVKLFS